MLNRPLWAEVSRHRLLGNYEKLRRKAGSHADLMPVVKANAYGHDVLLCAPLLAEAGAPWLGVTSTSEGMAVRAVCPQVRRLNCTALRWVKCEASMWNTTRTPAHCGFPLSLTCIRSEYAGERPAEAICPLPRTAQKRAAGLSSTV